MEQNKKRFLSILVLVGILWTFSLSILGWANKKINQEKEEIQQISQNIASLQEESHALNQTLVEDLKKKNQALSQRLSQIATRLQYEEKERSEVLFEEQSNQKLQELRHKAKQAGIKLETSVFPKPNYKSFHRGYWVALDTAYRLLSFFLSQSSSESCVKSIVSVQYPTLFQLPSSQKRFLTGIAVEITFVSNFFFVWKLISHCSQEDPNCGFPFFQLQDLKITPLSWENDEMQVKITLVLLKVNMQGEICQENVGKSESPPTPVKWAEDYNRY